VERFEAYATFTFLIFQFSFSGRGEPRITETTDIESVDTGTRLYFVLVWVDIMKLG
jgi:hypothetical protein